MGRPLRIFNTSDLREMSDAEIKGRIVPLILEKFAADSNPALKGNIVSRSGHDPTGGIGNFSDTIRTNQPGYHTASTTSGTGSASHTTTTNYSISQETGAESSAPTWPVGWEGSGVIGEMNTAKLKTDILRCCTEVWKLTGSSTGVGSYRIATADPAK